MKLVKNHLHFLAQDLKISNMDQLSLVIAVHSPF